MLVVVALVDFLGVVVRLVAGGAVVVVACIHESRSNVSRGLGYAFIIILSAVGKRNVLRTAYFSSK